jgi:NAD(P)-dependent dehydrogenase (short-subunit alcohol dehydrogenase family)
MPDRKLAGKVALIGGASKNLGSLISRTLAKQGAKVVVHYNNAASKSPAEETVAAIQKEGGQAFAVQPFFYPAETPDSIAYHKSASMNGKLTDIKDIAPIIEFLVTDGWWITGQTIFANGGYTTR